MPYFGVEAREYRLTAAFAPAGTQITADIYGLEGLDYRDPSQRWIETDIHTEEEWQAAIADPDVILAEIALS